MKRHLPQHKSNINHDRPSKRPGNHRNSENDKTTNNCFIGASKPSESDIFTLNLDFSSNFSTIGTLKTTKAN